MSENKKSHCWETIDRSYYTKEVVQARIRSSLNFRNVQHAIALLKQSDKEFKHLHIAEVGCGSGTFSLMFAMLGASITLIDYCQEVLDCAQDIYKSFGCPCQIVKADCLDVPPAELSGKFDMVSSGGLAEHFEGADREKCIRFHKDLLAKNGFVCIGLPNKLSPFYWAIRIFRTITGTWGIGLEKTYSYKELLSIATKVGLNSPYVLGTQTLAKDFRVYSRGLISALVDVFPNKIKKGLRNWKNRKSGSEVKANNELDYTLFLKNSFEQINNLNTDFSKDRLTNKYSSGLVLFGFKG